MTFGMNPFVVVGAAVAAFVFGAAYYGLLSRPWMRAARIEPKAGPSVPGAGLLVNSLVCTVIMAWVLAWLITRLGAPSLRTGMVAALFAWLGFVATTLSVNQRYQGFGWTLTVIDALHWLGALALMGAIMGGLG